MKKLQRLQEHLVLNMGFLPRVPLEFPPQEPFLLIPLPKKSDFQNFVILWLCFEGFFETNI